MPEYGRCPIPFRNTLQLGVAYVQTFCDATGRISSRQFWNHASGGWEPAPRDDAKHVRLLERLSDDVNDPDNSAQYLFVQREPMEEVNTNTHIYAVNSSGVVTDNAYDPMPRNYILLLSSQGR